MVSEPESPASPVLACWGGERSIPIAVRLCRLAPDGPPGIGILRFARNDNVGWSDASGGVWH